MKSDDLSPRGPRPMTAFFVSLVISSVLMGGLLLSDRRVLELRRARMEVVTLDRQIAEQRKENDALRVAIDAAGKHEFPAEKVNREELNLVAPDDVVLLYPPGSLTKPEPGSAAKAATSPATAPAPTPPRAK
jgi:cell division protein FtsB